MKNWTQSVVLYIYSINGFSLVHIKFSNMAKGRILKRVFQENKAG